MLPWILDAGSGKRGHSGGMDERKPCEVFRLSGRFGMLPDLLESVQLYSREIDAVTIA